MAKGRNKREKKRRKRKKRKSMRKKRRTHDDRRLRKERKKGRRKNKPKTRTERNGKREEVVNRRTKYEKKLPFNRWEAAERWKGRRKEKTGRRRQENQEERRPWLVARVNEAEERIRHYERKPREYTDMVEGEKEVGKGGKKEKAGRDQEKGWGMWKTYREGDKERILMWKKGILAKKERTKGNGSEWMSWERERYYPEYGKRRERHENQRKVRRSEYKMEKNYMEIEEKGERESEKRKERKEPWLNLGLEMGKDPYEPEKEKPYRNLDRHESQVMYQERAKEVQGNFALTMRYVKYEERRKGKRWKKRKQRCQKNALRWSPVKARLRRKRRYYKGYTEMKGREKAERRKKRKEKGRCRSG